MEKVKHILWICGLLALMACAPQTDAPQAGSPLSLTPYATQTLTPAPPQPTPAEVFVPTPVPTPLTYVVQRGDTLLGIALQFGIRLEDLQAANPGVSPQAISVGATLVIPTTPQDLLGGAPPPPADVELSSAQCYPAGDGGVWCLALAHNPFDTLLENVAVQLTVINEGEAVEQQTVVTPLNIIPPGAALPIAAYFSQPLPPNASLHLLPVSAILLLPADPRYLNVSAQGVVTQVARDGRSARVSGQAYFAGQTSPQGLWLVAVAYDEAGNLTGFRRVEFESPALAQGAFAFSLDVFALARDIARVEVVLEARP
jgi:LysM repeat protein